MATKTIPQLTALGANVAVDDQLEISDTSNSDASRKVTQAQLVAILGTPASGTLTNCTGLPVSTGVSGLGTGVATALAINVGSAGAPVVLNGALGTPSSGTVTNLTGTASININGTVGATTPAAGLFTTVGGTGAFYALSGTAIPAGGTAGSGYKFSSTSNFGLFFGSGAPTLAAARGSLYLRSDGTPYYNTDGSTTWSAVGGGGSGTVTVVGSGSLTSTALVTGGGTTELQTPAATATMNSSGDISTPGDIACVDLAASGNVTLGAISDLGTPGGGTLTNCDGLPVSTGISGLGTGVATALAVNVGSAGAPVVLNGALGTPSSGTLSSCAGLKTAVKITAANYTVGTTDANELYGGVIYVTSAATITIPAVAAGASFSVVTVGANAVSVDPNASDLIIRDGTAQADGEKVTNLSTAGDIAVFTYYDATGWYCSSNAWTNGG